METCQAPTAVNNKNDTINTTAISPSVVAAIAKPLARMTLERSTR
jgi:hypothetical protein